MVESTVNGSPNHAWGAIKILDMGLRGCRNPWRKSKTRPPRCYMRRCFWERRILLHPNKCRDARSVDIRADPVFVGLYFLLRSDRPSAVSGGNDVQKLIKHQSERPVAIDELARTFPIRHECGHRFMAKEPDDRYQSPQELADVLADYLASTLPQQTPQQTPPRGVSTAAKPKSKLNVPSPIPRSRVSTHAVNGPQFLDGFDSEVGIDSDPLPQAPTAMEETSQSKEVGATAMLSAHSGVVAAVAISQDGRFAASGGVDGRCAYGIFHSPNRVRWPVFRDLRRRFRRLRLRPTIQTTLSSAAPSRATRVHRWDWVENRVFEWGAFATTDHRGVGGLAFAANGSILAAGIGSFAVTWKINRRNASSRNILKGMAIQFGLWPFLPIRVC